MQIMPQQKQTLTLPELILMLTLVLLPLLEGGFDHLVIYWVLFLLLGVSMLLTYLEKWPVSLDIQAPLLWYGLFVFWGGLSIFWSLNPHRTLVEFLQISCYGLVFFLARRLDEDNIFRVGRIALIAGVGVALFGISQYIFLSSSRIQATFTNANPLGIYLAMLFLLGWAYYLRRPNRWLAVGCVTLLVALALSGSRGAFICFFLVLPFLFVGLRGRVLYSAFFKTVICIVTALIITQGIMATAPYLQKTVGGHLAAFLIRPESFIATSGVGRLAFWEVGGRLALLEPLKGHGLGTFFLAYYLEYQGNEWYARFVHNHYLQVLAELGLVGFGLLAAFLTTCARKARQQVRHGSFTPYFPGLLAVMAAFLLHIGGDFSWNFPGAAVIFFASAGVAVGVGTDQAASKQINYKHVLPVLAVLLSLTLWQFSANMLYRQGVRLDSQGKVAEATLVYERANTIYPINSMAYSFASRNYLLLAQEREDPALLEKALVSAQKAVSLSPVDANLHNNLGRIYWQLGRMAEAEHHLVLAVEYAAYRLNLFMDLGWFLLQQRRNEEAEAVLQRGLELEEAATKSVLSADDWQRVQDQLLQLHLLLAHLYYDTGKPELLEYHMQAARALDPEHQLVQQYFRK